MTTDTFTAGTDDGLISGSSLVYATARSTSDTATDNATTASVGQRLAATTYVVFRGFIGFDTSSIPDDAVISDATLYLTADSDSSATDFDIDVYRYDWASTLAANREANYDGAYGGSATSEGTLRNTSSGWSSGTTYSMSVDPNGVNTSGTTRYTIVSGRDVGANTPTGNEFVTWRTADHGTAESRPMLEVTYTVPDGDGVPNALLMMGVGS